MGTVHPAPFGATDGDDGGELLQHYRIAVEEYRFQVNLNWSRTQYLLVFNTAILAAAAAVVRLETTSTRVLAALLLVVGAASAGGSLLVTRRQHDYYRAARDQVRDIARRLQLGQPGRPPALATTAGMRGEPGARLKVRTTIDGLFVLIAGIDVGAAAYLLV